MLGYDKYITVGLIQQILYRISANFSLTLSLGTLASVFVVPMQSQIFVPNHAQEKISSRIACSCSQSSCLWVHVLSHPDVADTYGISIVSLPCAPAQVVVSF